jgi:predicted O-linked N-acetylglucosamine transferase (SPINDLY family)
MDDIESAKRCFYEAAALLDAGNYSSAVLRLREALGFAPDNVSILTNLAAALLMQGKMQEAITTAERILLRDARNRDALVVLSECLAREGRYSDLLPVIDQVIALEPGVAEHHSNRATALQCLGRPAEALKDADAAINLKPELAAAHLTRGNCLADLKSTNEAIAAFERARTIDPRLAEAWLGLGNAYAELGRLDDASAAYERALALNPGLSRAWTGRGNLLAVAGRQDEALAAFDKALAVSADLAAAWLGRGVALEAINRPTDALSSYDKAITLDPTCTTAWFRRGHILSATSRRDDALAAFDKALTAAPDIAEGWLGRGNLLAETRRDEEALAAFDKAIELAPNLAEAWRGRGVVLGSLGRFEEAVAAYDAALAADPSLEYVRGGRWLARARLCDWSHYDAEIADILAGVRNGANIIAPFDMIHLATSAADQLACARIHVAARCPPQSVPIPAASRRGDKINIAYLSADYRYHPISMLLAGVFEHHDRTRFRTFGISFGRDDETAIRRRIKGAFDSFVDADTMGAAATANFMREHEIDIAIDLMGFTSESRPGIFALRAAPIQVNYLGYPASMGASYMDYIIADPYTVLPEHEGHYDERIVRLPDTFQANDGLRPYPSRIPSRGELGLPENVVVFCSFNSLTKLSPAMFDACMGIIKEADDCVLWLLSEGAASERNLRREAAARGVAPERLVFAPRVPYAEYLARFRAADLFLDTFPFNGGTTISDALWMGLPAVTVSGETFASRMAGSLLRAAGLAGLATDSLAAYQQLAVELARDRSRLAGMRAKLDAERATSPLFDTARFCRHIEAAYEMMYERHQRGEAPATFAVSPIDG